MRTIISTIFIVFFALSCQANESNGMTLRSLMAEKEWDVTHINETQFSTPKTLKISDMTIYGQTGCKGFFSDFTQNGSTFEIQGIGMNRAGPFCYDEQGLIRYGEEQEAREKHALNQHAMFLTALEKMSRVVKVENGLRLEGDDGTSLLLVERS